MMVPFLVYIIMHAVIMSGYSQKRTSVELKHTQLTHQNVLLRLIEALMTTNKKLSRKAVSKAETDRIHAAALFARSASATATIRYARSGPHH